MKSHACSQGSPFFLVIASVFAGELPEIPAEPIANKKELLFSDDFERTELGKAWAIVVPMYSLENGTLRGNADALRWIGSRWQGCAAFF